MNPTLVNNSVSLIALIAVHACAGQEPGITQILPTISQLGEGWSWNRVVTLVDPLSSPSEVTDKRDVSDPEATLRERREMLARNDLAAHGFIRYYHGDEQYGVFITRFKTGAAVEETWKRMSKEEKPVIGVSSGIGENLCAYKERGMNNDVSFRRGNYLIVVECSIKRGTDKLVHLARALDGNLQKVFKAVGTSGTNITGILYVLETTCGGVVPITNEPSLNPVHVSFKEFELRPQGEVAIFSVTNAGKHRILPWCVRVQVRTADSREEHPRAGTIHSGWKTVQDEFPPSGSASPSARPGELDKIWVNRPDHTPWRVCLLYSTDWDDTGRTASGNYEVISQEMTE